METSYLTREWSRKVDELAIRNYGMSGLVLMENAGRGCADLLERLGIHGPVLICCGKGNNAGDGFVIARHLDLRGYQVRVLLWSDPKDLRGDAAANYEIVSRAQIPLIACPGQADHPWIEEQLFSADWILDALLGTGSTGTPRAPLDSAILVMNQSAAKKLAIDLPSGLDCDLGVPSNPTVRADHTATFVAAKRGFLAAEAQDYLGVVHVLDIGAPRKLVEEIMAAGNVSAIGRDSVS